MKKIFKYIPIFLIAFCLTFGKQIIFANNEEKTLQVERKEYSNEIVEYIEKNWKSFFGRDELEEYSNSNTSIIIGEPYSVYHIDDNEFGGISFPTFVNGKCTQVLHIFKDSSGNMAWSATLTNSFLREIDELKEKTGKYRFEVKDNPTGGKPDFKLIKIDEKNVKSIPNSKYSNIGKPLLTFKVEYKKKIEDRSANYPDKKILPMQPKETQGTRPWCATYAGARILSYEFSKDIRAKDIMEWVHWSFW